MCQRFTIDGSSEEVVAVPILSSSGRLGESPGRANRGPRSRFMTTWREWNTAKDGDMIICACIYI